MTLLGGVTAAWSQAEGNLAIYYGWFLFGPAPSPDKIPVGAFIAMRTFEMIISVPQRIDLLREAVRMRGFGNAILTKFNRRLEELQDAVNDRNTAAHGRWALSEKHPDHLVHVKNLAKLQDARLFDQKDLETAISRINHCSVELHNLVLNEMLPILKTLG
jgi:hypothetical protein